MSRYRAVFFDLGGTLFAYESAREYLDALLLDMAARRRVRKSLEELRRLYRAAIRGSMARHAERPFYLHRDLFAEAHVTFLESLGVKPEAEDADVADAGRLALGDAWVTPRVEAVDTLEALRARGLRIVLVSNIDREQFERLWPRIGLDAYFDGIVTSEEARSCKPHARIFELALERSGDPAPEQVLFVGDSVEHDVVGANALGMGTALIGGRPARDAGLRTPDHVISDLSELVGIVAGGSATSREPGS